VFCTCTKDYYNFNFMASDKSKVYNAETVILVVCMKKKSSGRFHLLMSLWTDILNFGNWQGEGECWRYCETDEQNGKKHKKRGRQDSNLRGQSPHDF
jgi:hypothetical protein